MVTRPVPLAAVVSVCALLVGTAALMTLLGVALTADGAYFLVRVLETETVFGPLGRWLANAARQLPVLLAMWSGVSDTQMLSQAHGLGQLVLPAVVWSAAIVLVRDDRVVFVAVATTAAVCAGGTWLFSVSENVLAVPLTVLVAVLLWRPGPWRWRHVLVAGATAAVLVSSYETAALLGLLLAVWAGWRGATARTRIERYGCAFVTLASTVSIGIAIIGAAGAGPGPRHAQWFLYYLVSLEPWPVYVASAGIALVVLALELRAAETIRRGVLALGMIVTAIGVVGTETTVSGAYEARAGASAVTTALVLYLWWHWAGDRRGRDERADVPRWIVLVPVAAATVSAVVLVDASLNWARDLDTFRAEVRAHEGIVLAEEVLPPDGRGALWDWTSPYLALLVRESADDAILVDRRPSYVPFAPSDVPALIPDEYVWDR
jgi:hypothetical protein